MGLRESRERGVHRRGRLVLFTAAAVVVGLVLVAATIAFVDDPGSRLALSPAGSSQATAASDRVAASAAGPTPPATSPAPAPPSAVIVGVGSPPPTTLPPSATPGDWPSVSPSGSLDPPPAPGPFAIDLYRHGAFVHEASRDMCVAAAMQTMLNIIGPTIDDSVATQKEIYALARALSPATLKGPGAEPEGWAKGLSELGAGRYAVSVRGSMVNAVHAAARALRLTGRPVGLLTWYGAHSWVMSGFTATADPAWTDTYTVTAVSIEDVWYPSISSIWGRSRPPDSLVPIDRLARDFLPWRMPGGPYPDKAWKFVTVVPIVPQS